ncbi:MAG: hypothetical protein LBI74_03635 [Synergistaceae bacterium]|jgi:alanyl-tRNA synthetase|nr:hypothetical protein [Synergistaceae bacterium]
MSDLALESFKTTFHKGSLRERSVVTYIVPYGDSHVIVSETTPFHPRDYQWPDHPADRGFIENSLGRRYDLADVVFVGRDPDGNICVDSGIPAKKNDPGWSFCVGHVILGVRPNLSEGDPIILQVDNSYRWRLSRAHSAAHVMSFALNQSFAQRWRRKIPYIDDMGNPNFDAVALEKSNISPLSCVDRYRLGKSLKRRGFTVDGLKDDISRYEEEINRMIDEWMQNDAPISVESDGDNLTSIKCWNTTLDGVDVEMPCNGTHVSRLSEIGTIIVNFEIPDEETLIITTSVR